MKNIMFSFKHEKHFELMKLQSFEHLTADVDFKVVLIDFGLGKIKESLGTRTDNGLGAEAFRAPETLGVENIKMVDHANSDLYSIAAILLRYACPVSDLERSFIKMTWQYTDEKMLT